MKRLAKVFGILSSCLLLTGCAEYIAAEFALAAAQAISENKKSSTRPSTSSESSAPSKLNQTEQQKINKALLSMPDAQLCTFAVSKDEDWEKNKAFEKHVREAQRRGLSCGVVESSNTQITSATSSSSNSVSSTKDAFKTIKTISPFTFSEAKYKNSAVEVFPKEQRIVIYGHSRHFDNIWSKIHESKQAPAKLLVALGVSSADGSPFFSGKPIKAEALSLSGKKAIRVELPLDKKSYKLEKKSPYLRFCIVSEGLFLCSAAYNIESKRNEKSFSKLQKVFEAIKFEKNGFADTQIASPYPIGAGLPESKICERATFKAVNEIIWHQTAEQNWVTEAKLRGFTCGVGKTSTTLIASANTPSSNSVPSAALTAAQREADELRKKLGALEAKQKQEQRAISNDTRVPLIDQLAANSSGKQGIISGRVRDNTGIAEVTVDGMVVQVRSDGRFEHRTFIPADGKQVLIEATDLAGLTSQKQLSLSRDTAIQSASISFDSLNPLGKRTVKNRDALALIVGVEGYKNTPAQAIYADSDAKMFRDYASEKLGIPENRIETLINDGAELTDMLLSVKEWLTRSVKQDRSDVYVFFAGHGLASDDGEKMYLLPYDGSPRLLDRTAILRDELFSDIAAANPRSVTVFLDTCYSGTTRGTDMLVASRPIAIRAKQQNIPDGFTVFTAAGGDQTAKPLEEAKHGMFSYFLMKGMEGDADSNSDNQITATELHQYVEQNVVRQSGGSQVPELQGDAGRVLVRFQ